MTTPEERDQLLATLPFAAAVAAERIYQRQRWSDNHDDEHWPSEWALMILRYAGRLGETLEQCLSGTFKENAGADQTLVRPAAMDTAEIRACRVCGCTDDDCSGCVERTGEPCHWVETDLCSACQSAA